MMHRMHLAHAPLPDGLSARRGHEPDRDYYADLSVRTLGIYAREVFGLDEASARHGLHAEYDADATTIVIDGGGTAVGLVVVMDRGSELWLDHMVIEPEAQGRGIGTALAAAVQEVARARDVPVTLSVVEGNPARALYERLGFVFDREVPPRTFLVWRPRSR